ncbi:RDD family protein [Thalassotalea fonticola]|uniref:RDD family protein n=1 Tax=Thalassotalea fonticola TaxID=3065649 RepID=A0ABZ0GSX0_9GAMM|nr:RDD family protein [Colwelliaceae bacterium S1-1]
MINIFAKTKKKLTFDETQEIITPFAFKFNEELFGTAIASPWKRGVAISIDFLLIAALSGAGGELLAIALAIMAFRMGSKRRAEQQGKVKGRKRRAIMRFFGALIVLVLLLNTLPPLMKSLFGDGTNEQSQEELRQLKEDGVIIIGDKDVNVGTAFKMAGYAIKTIQEIEKHNCTELSCWQEVLTEVPDRAVELGLNSKQATGLFTDVSESTELSEVDQEQLVQYLEHKYTALIELKQDMDTTIENEKREVVQQSIPAVENVEKPDINNYYEGHPEDQEKKNDRPIYSIIELFKGIIDDLGLGVGWAAFYFTVFTARWNGKTPGKRLMNIRVLQLDGTPLSLWDSFGRFGGYAAGPATGLLGFLQVYWDPNRQAIQDKISATVVIDEKKKVAQEIIDAAKEKYEKMV